MKSEKKLSKKRDEENERKHSADFTSPDIDNDKTGTDNDADETVKRNRSERSKLEIDPDSTGIDTKADKTKKEKFPKQRKK